MTDPRSLSFSCRPADARRKWVTASPAASVFKGITLGAGTPGMYRACSRSVSGCISMASSVGDVTVSTAHKAKGREWPAVKIADDFPRPQTATNTTTVVARSRNP